MEQDKNYFLGIDATKALLAVYGIEDVSNSLSTRICKWLEILLKTDDIANSEEISAVYEELLQAKQLQNILKSCIDKEISIRSKGFSNMKLTNVRLKNRILLHLEDFFNDIAEVDMSVAKSHFIHVPTDNEKLGFFATSLLNHTFKDSDIISLTKSKQYSLIYDLLLKAGKVYRDDCKHEGYKNGGRDKFLQVQDWIRAFKNYYKFK